MPIAPTDLLEFENKRKVRVELTFLGPQPNVMTVIRHPPLIYLIKLSIKKFVFKEESRLSKAKLELQVVGTPPCKFCA